MKTKKSEEKWYEWYISILFFNEGKQPIIKGPFSNDEDFLERYLMDLRKFHPEKEFWILHSRCGKISIEKESDWIFMREAAKECHEEERKYIETGICSDCGACSLKEAETKCRPRPLADTGDYICGGENLWRNNE